VLLTGGSAFGLAAADGVMRYLEERGVGLETPAARVPIVPAAVLYDLGVGDPNARPGPEQGYLACAAASADVPEGTVGAGTGATVAKLRGSEGAASGGIGTAAVQEGDLVVGAIAAVNAFGEVIDDAGDVLVGSSVPAQTEAAPEGGGTNTTLVIVATNAALSKERANLISQAAHDGIERAVRPAHTLWDGDTAFALATGAVPADQRQLERLAIDVVAEAIRRGCAAGR